MSKNVKRGLEALLRPEDSIVVLIDHHHFYYQDLTDQAAIMMEDNLNQISLTQRAG
ncbi:hypothetical protein M1D52_10525 [Olivibacter sp. SA151]|uniref:hypothetical protein n=1 Tax=Olivibacter jilunii TaxID=985016 RepID=UPI003F183E26